MDIISTDVIENHILLHLINTTAAISCAISCSRFYRIIKRLRARFPLSDEFQKQRFLSLFKDGHHRLLEFFQVSLNYPDFISGNFLIRTGLSLAAQGIDVIGGG